MSFAPPDANVNLPTQERAQFFAHCTEIFKAWMQYRAENNPVILKRLRYLWKTLEIELGLEERQ